MASNWDIIQINQLLADQVEESLTLEYKSSKALDKGKKEEITKDISAMANSAGGTIIYGINEHSELRHLPGTLDSIDRKITSKEWIEQIISNIQPKIPNIIITPITTSTDDSNQCVYVVEIPQGTTAHQALDKKYYKRYNFQSVPMEHYEVLDILSRQHFPKFELSFFIEDITTVKPISSRSSYSVSSRSIELVIEAMNIGGVLAQYVNIDLEIPSILLPGSLRNDNSEITIVVRDNTQRDIISYEGDDFSSLPIYGTSWYAPILAGRKRIWKIELTTALNKDTLAKIKQIISWRLYVDNAGMTSGSISINDLLYIIK